MLEDRSYKQFNTGGARFQNKDQDRIFRKKSPVLVYKVSLIVKVINQSMLFKVDELSRNELWENFAD